MTNHDPLIGKTLRGEYVIEAILGEGGMGAVYRARQKSLDRIVAVKIMHPYIAKEKGFIDRFNREAQTSARLEHPNIVPIYDYGQEDGYVYLVMRLLTGGTLSERLSADKRLPSLAEVARIVKQIAGALDYAHHKGVIHRDMKPSNIMFDENGTPYLVDFGIAKLVSSNSGLTHTGVAMGTPNFMPPEQWRGGDAITASVDQYALGVIVYNTLTGKLPFEGDTPAVLMYKHLNEYPTPLTQYRADLPPSVMNILLQALAKDAQARFNSCSQFANALESVAQGGEYGAQTNVLMSSTPPQRGRTPTSPKTPYSTQPQNRRGMIIGAVGIVALLLIGGLLALLSGGGDDTANQSATSTVGSVVILITDTPSPTTELSPTDTLSPTPSLTSTETPTPDVLTAIAYIDETNTAQAPLNLTATAQAQQVTPTTDFTATIDAIMANRTATQQIAESIATNLAQKATDQAITDLTATQNAVSNIAQQSNADQLATQAALDRIATEIALDQTATATLWTLTPSITPTVTLTYTPTYTPSPTATATFTPTAIPPDAILGRVNVRGGLNLRRDPDSTAEILFLIPENTVLIITARNSNSEWVYGSLPTEAGLIYGWVFAQYVTITDAVGNPVNLSDVGDMAVLEPVLPPPEQTDLELVPQMQATVILSAHLDDVIGAIELSDGRILSWAYDATLRLWDNSGDLIGTLSGHTSVIWGALELSDGRILSWSWDGTLRLWDNDGSPISTLTGHTEAIRGAVEANNGTIISWAWDNTIRVWDMNGNLIATINFPYEGLVKTIALRNGHILAWGNDNTLIMWDGLGNLVNNLTGHTDIVWDAIELNDGRILSSSQDKTLRLWDNDGNPISTLTGHTDLVIGAIQLTDGRILSYSQDMTLRLWDNTGNLIHTFVGHTFFVSRVIELPDNRILSISTDNTMKSWDATTGELITTYVGHTAPLWRGIALGDGRVLSMSDDKMMIVWDMNGSPILRLMGHEGFVFAIQLRDGRILSWSNNLDDDIITDTTLRIWDIGAPPLTPEATSTLPDMAVLEPVSMLDEVMFSSLLATIEGGTFNMGTTAREVSSAVEECITRDSAQCTIQMGEDSVPVHTVTLDTFLIEATEVTNAQYIAFLNWMGANSHTDGCLGQRCITIIAEDDASYIAFDGQTYSVVNTLFDDFPMVNVTWYGAQAYCQTIGRRLPTEAEWERTARGTQDFIYPWGNIWDDSLANTRNSGLEGLMFVRNFIAGQSPFGVFDMAGNAAEWVNDWYSEAYYRSPEASQVNPQGPATGTERIVRGGSWDAVPFFARTVHRQSLSPDTASPSVGFRCASDYVETSSAIAPTPVVGQLVLVQQDFEKGNMFWFEATNEIWVIFDDESREWQKHQSAWNVTMPISDDTIVPPNGLYQPVRGFGLLWRTDTDLRDRLGWATAQEFGYVADYLYFIENTQVYHVIVGLDDISYIFDENNQTWLEFENSPQ